MARFLPTEVRDILLAYLLYVRPFETFVNIMLHGNSVASAYQQFLFVTRGKELSGAKLRRLFRQEIQRQELPLSFQSWRHLLIGVVRVKIKPVTSLGDLFPEFDLQAAHSVKAGEELYGLETYTQQTLPNEILDKYHFTSSSVQAAILGLTPAIKWQQPYFAATPTEFNSDGLKALVKQAINEELQDFKSAAQTGLIREHNATNYDAIGGTQIPTSSPESQNETNKIQQQLNLVHLLRRFMLNDKTRFRNDYQAAAVFNAIHARRDQLVVLPTGGGKSLTFYLSAMHHRHLCTVVISPLVSLKQDLIRRANENNLIQVDEWSDSLRFSRTGFAQIVFVSVEQAALQPFRTWLVRNAKNISRLFIDEAHLLQTQCDFRTYFYDVHHVRATAIPLTFLSATVPKYVENALKTFFSIDSWDVIRARTMRPNLKYAVVESRDIDELNKNFGNALVKMVRSFNVTGGDAQV